MHAFIRQFALRGALAMAAIAAMATPALAQFAVLNVPDGLINNFGSTDRTLGFTFSVNTSVTVDNLGVWDHNIDGLLDRHFVGIWDSGGTLLGSTIIGQGGASPAAGPIIQNGQLRFEPVNIPLLAGQDYTIGALYNDNDVFISSASSFVMSPEFSFIDERFSAGNDGFTFPTFTAGRFGLLGPGFTFREIPEPGTLTLVGLGGLTLLRRRRS